MTTPTETFETFEQFWPHFLAGHRLAATRWAHVAAIVSGAAGAVVAVRRGSVWPLVAGAGAAAVLAVGAHPVFEGNSAENFGRPMWATRGLVRLCWRTVTGTIVAEVEALGPPG